MNRNIGILCASSNRMEPVFYEGAKRLGEWIGRQGRTLVYGGANCGLMETLARSVHESGGRVLGVVPQILVDNDRVSGFIDEMVLTPDLNQRKQGIIDRSDIIIAMPGRWEPSTRSLPFWQPTQSGFIANVCFSGTSMGSGTSCSRCSGGSSGETSSTSH